LVPGTSSPLEKSVINPKWFGCTIVFNYAGQEKTGDCLRSQ
jgi:hypothetical protein